MKFKITKTAKIILTVVFFLSTILYVDATANTVKEQNPPKWIQLGKRTVSKLTDHDEIRVTAIRGTFKKLRLKVTRSPIYVTNVKVVYANGTSENHVINKRINKGHFSRVLDLKGKKRIIKKIIFNYKTKLLARGKAQVIVYGKR